MVSHAAERTPDHYLAIPSAGSGPAVLVLHSWWGLNQFFRRLCGRLAAEGFVALAPDLYGGRVATTVQAARRLRATATRGRREPVYRFLIRQMEHLIRHDATTGSTIGVLGCSMGGHWAFWLSQRPELPIRATVTFYAARGGDFTGSRSSFLCHFAERDDWVSAAAIRNLARQLARADRPAELHGYPRTGHWFFESDPAGSYHAGAARLAWTRTLRVLSTCLEHPPTRPQ